MGLRFRSRPRPKGCKWQRKIHQGLLEPLGRLSLALPDMSVSAAACGELSADGGVFKLLLLAPLGRWVGVLFLPCRAQGHWLRP